MIEFQYFDSCPNSKASLVYLKELIAEGVISENEITITEIVSMEDAENLNFQGSPTILVNGYDIYTEEKPVDYHYSCRVYDFDGNRTGIIPKHFIQDQVAKLQ